MLSSAAGGRRRTSNGSEPMQAGLVPEDGDRARTPISQRRGKQADAPSTPNLEGNRRGTLGLTTPDVTLAPKAVRAFPGSPGGVSLPDSNSVTDDAAQQELRELLGVGGGEAHRRLIENGKHANKHGAAGDSSTQSEQNRPLSSVSTSAGPTPSPDGRSSPHFASSALVSGGDKRNVNASRDGKQLSKAMPSQVRKIFVGGIPQDMQQDDLFKLFNAHAPVKKAWLQRYRDASKVKSPSTHNHRGFGFVIFEDSSAVENLLGKNFSRFIALKDGRKLEVKRAQSSSDMASPSSSVQPRNLDVPDVSKGPSLQQAEHASVSVAAVSGQRSVQGLTQPQGFAMQESRGAASNNRVNAMQPAVQRPWPADPRAPWMNSATPPLQQPQQQNLYAASHAPAPWPTSGGDALPPQSMSPPPQQMQQLFPAVPGVPLAAPTAVRAPAGVVMSGQCGIAQVSAAGMNWTSQTPPPMQIPSQCGTPVPAGMPCSADGTAPQMQPMYNAYATWAPIPGSPTPPPQAQPMQLQQQPFPQQTPVAWQQPPQQMQQMQYMGNLGTS